MPGSARSACAIMAVVLLLSAMAGARATSPSLLSDRDAASLIESWFAGSGWTESVRTGRLVVTSEIPACAGSDIEHGRVSESEYKATLAWAAAGLVKLAVVGSAAGPPSLAQAISTKCAPLVMRRIVVTPTAGGVALDGHTPVTGMRDARFLYARTYKAEVSRIVDNTELRQNTDVYRIVKCVVRFHYSDVGRALTRLRYGSVLEHQKQIVLLKYDPFEKRWSLVTSDAAAIDNEFKTQRVADYLLQHGSL